MLMSLIKILATLMHVGKKSKPKTATKQFDANVKKFIETFYTFEAYAKDL